MRITKSLGTPDYYAIDAQLQGDGTVSCQILVDGKVVSQATASGGYNIASCEISQDPFSGNWEDTNQGREDGAPVGYVCSSVAELHTVLDQSATETSSRLADDAVTRPPGRIRYPMMGCG